MAQLVEVLVVFTLFPAVLFWRDYGLHAYRNCIGQDVICVITPVRQQNFRRNAVNQVDSFFTIDVLFPIFRNLEVNRAKELLFAAPKKLRL